MPNRPAPFKQADVTRALKGWAAAGLSEPRVECRPDGTIILTPAGQNEGKAPNDFDE